MHWPITESHAGLSQGQKYQVKISGGGTLFYSELPSSLFNLGMPTLFSGAHLTKPVPTQCPFLSECPLKIYQRPLVGGTAQVEDHWSNGKMICSMITCVPFTFQFHRRHPKQKWKMMTAKKKTCLPVSKATILLSPVYIAGKAEEFSVIHLPSHILFMYDPCTCSWAAVLGLSNYP